MFSTLHNAKNGQPIHVALHNVTHLSPAAHGRTVLNTVNNLGLHVLESVDQVEAIAKGEKPEGMDAVEKEAADLRASLDTQAHLPSSGRAKPAPKAAAPEVSDKLKDAARASAAARADAEKAAAAAATGDGEEGSKRTVPKVTQGAATPSPAVQA